MSFYEMTHHNSHENIYIDSFSTTTHKYEINVHKEWFFTQPIILKVTLSFPNPKNAPVPRNSSYTSSQGETSVSNETMEQYILSKCITVTS